MSITPCELHEITNCSTCTGFDKKHEASLEDSLDRDRGVLPVIPGGPTIWSNFPGTCAGCGRRYPANTAIHHDRDKHDGWVGVECCA